MEVAIFKVEIYFYFVEIQFFSVEKILTNEKIQFFLEISLPGGDIILYRNKKSVCPN